MDNIDGQTLAIAATAGSVLLAAAGYMTGLFGNNNNSTKNKKKKSKKKKNKTQDLTEDIKNTISTTTKQVPKPGSVPVAKPGPVPVAKPASVLVGKEVVVAVKEVNEGEGESKKKKKKNKKKSKGQGAVVKDVVLEESSEEEGDFGMELKTKKKKKEKQTSGPVMPIDVIRERTGAVEGQHVQLEEEDGWVTVPIKRHTSSKMEPAFVETVEAVGNAKKKEKKLTLDIGEHISVILGEGGSTIANIESMSGAKVHIDREKKLCTIIGDDMQVDMAKRLVTSIISNQDKHEMTLTSRLDKAILNKADTKNKIRNLSGAKIDFRQAKGKDEDLEIVITGEVDKVAKAKSLIEAYLSGKTPEGGDGVKRMQISAYQGKILIGVKGQTIATLQKDSGATINVEFVDNYAVISVIGEDSQIERGVDSIKTFLADHSFSTMVNLPDDARPGVLKNLNDLRKDFPSLKVEMAESRDSITLTGSEDGVKEGRNRILGWIDSELGPPVISANEAITEIDLGSAAGKVIGKNRTTLNGLLEKAPGAKVDIKSGTLCYVYGSPSAVKKLAGEIEDIVSKHNEVVQKTQDETRELQNADWVVMTDKTTTNEPQYAPESDWGGFKLAQLQGW